MTTASRRTPVRAAAVTACAAALLALPAAAALAEGVPAASAAHTAGAPRTPVKSLGLADGVSTAKVHRVSEGVYQAEILAADGSLAATVTSRDGIPAVGGAGPLHAALQPDGRLSSWVGDPSAPNGTPGGDGYKTGTRDGHGVPGTTPRTHTIAAGATGVLGLDTLADEPGDGLLLVAAGAGMAAVGAAGLGFALLRRGRSEG
ncbi:hypothetical protein ABZ128_18340 [Streptomyces sp. NPDC006326]|uniref:hypothetical protein n=1 Tax=Streptomyces sp. NPDC006326 TaxID=3156752 RepID=UPI0033B93BFD